jgi:outer membrane protein assembly factor BamA
MFFLGHPRAVWLVFGLGLSGGSAWAQSSPGGISRDAPSIEDEVERAAAGESGNFVAAPIPFSNPAFGTGLAAVGAYMYRVGSDDPEVPASFTGIGGLYSDTKTWGFGFAQNLYLKEDRVRIGFFAGTAELNYDFYGVGSEAGERGRGIALSQSGDAVGARFEYRVGGDYFVGFRLGALDIETSTELSDVPPEFQAFELTQDSRIEDLGLLLQRDTRDQVYTPDDGSLLELDIGLRRLKTRSTTEYRKMRFAFTRYLPRNDSVLAYRVYACYAGDGSPFYDLCAFGSRSDLRGYTAGRYLDRTELVTQIEYRRPLRGRWGIVAFAGVGTVAPSFADMNADDLLPGAGVGIRYLVSRAQNINLRVDVARGNDETTVHIGLGEAF